MVSRALVVMALLASPAWAQDQTQAPAKLPPAATYGQQPYATQPHGLDFDYFTSVLNERAVGIAERFLGVQRKVDALEKLLDQRTEEMTRFANERNRLNQLHLDARITELEKLIEVNLTSEREARVLALSTAKEAVDKAEKATEIHFASVNEFRATLTDQTSKFPPRQEVALQIQNLQSKITDMQRILDQTSGRDQGIGILWVGGISVVSLLITLASLAFKMRAPS